MVQQQTEILTGKLQRNNGNASSPSAASRRGGSILQQSQQGKLKFKSSTMLALLRPSRTATPGFSDVRFNPTLAQLDEMFPVGSLIACDIETRGVNFLLPDNCIVGVGLAGGHAGGKLAYCGLRDSDGGQVSLVELHAWLQNRRLIGHNVSFDAAWLWYKTHGADKKGWLQWEYDTYAMYRQLASEGFFLQKWGLKEAQIDLLQWDAKGDEELGKWLVLNGWYTGKRRKQHDDPNYLADGYAAKKLRPNKGEMWRAPLDILGYYCALDAMSTYMLLTDVFAPAVEGTGWEETYWAYNKTFMVNLRILIEARISGFRIDADKFVGYTQWIDAQVETALDAFLMRPDINEAADLYLQHRLDKWLSQEPHPKIGKEPTRITKTRKESVVWQRWNERKEKIEAGELKSTDAAWRRWKKRMPTRAVFKVTSPHLRKWLFYEHFKYEVLVRTKKNAPAVDKKALKGFGEQGASLKRFVDLDKERQMSESCWNVLHVYEEGETRIHPEFRVPGTLTCRLAGAGKFNLQQIPKRKEYLSCWVADPGWEIVDIDHTALEPVVLAALSYDETLWKLYGPNAKKNDIYLFNGANLPGMGEKIRAAGYDPDFPTVEGIEVAKKQCKKERGMAKTITLGFQYGMGVNKLFDTFKLDGVQVTKNECFGMFQAYWELYSGIKAYEKILVQEWERNNGWVLNGIGRPVCCAQDKLKDIVNRVVQSTGHDIHMMYVEIVERLLLERRLKYRWLIPDFHDQTIMQVREGQGDALVQLYKDAYPILNSKIKQLNPKFGLEITGSPSKVPSLAEAKVS